MESALIEGPSGVVYTLKESSVWIRAGGKEIWIINGDKGLSVSLWDSKTMEPIDSIFVTDGKCITS